MEIERIRRNGNHHFSSGNQIVDRIGRREKDSSSNNSTMSSGLLLMSSSPPSNSTSGGGGGGGGAGGGVNFIEHQVSKMDTLAGVAIKYGVEVADIKRMNGLVTDLQMFALKSLQIPLPGRHPPSTSLSNGSPTAGDSSIDPSPSRRAHTDLLESFQSLRLKADIPRVSSAMSVLQGYYGLKPLNLKESEGTEMSLYRTGRAHYLEDEPHSKPSPNRHRKTRSLVSNIFNENTNLAEDVPVIESSDVDTFSVRRRQSFDTDNSPRTPETLLKEDNNSTVTGFSVMAGKGLALRPKSSTRLALVPESDCWLNPLSMGDSVLVNGFTEVRKSSSTSNLQEQDSDGSPYNWTTSKRTIPNSTSNRSLFFDGLPKPVTARRNKAALD